MLKRKISDTPHRLRVRTARLVTGGWFRATAMHSPLRAEDETKKNVPAEQSTGTNGAPVDPVVLQLRLLCTRIPWSRTKTRTVLSSPGLASPAALHPVAVVAVVVVALVAVAVVALVASAGLGFASGFAAAVVDAVAAAVLAAAVVLAAVADLFVAVADGVAAVAAVDLVLAAAVGLAVAAAAAAAAAEVGRHHCEPHSSSDANRGHSQTVGRNHEPGMYIKSSPRHRCNYRFLRENKAQRRRPALRMGLNPSENLNFPTFRRVISKESTIFSIKA